MNRLIETLQNRVWLIYLILVGLTLMVYSFSLSNYFIWDDYMVLVDNPFVHNWDNLPKLFDSRYLTSGADLPYIHTGNYGSGEGSYRPLMTLMHFIEYRLWGLNPVFFHLMSVLAHALVVCLVFSLISRLFGNPFIAFVTATLFAVHPAHSEAILVVSFREDILATLFYILGFIYFIKGKAWSLFGAVVCFGLALFLKEVAITFPVLVFCYYYFYLKNKFDVKDFLITFGGFAIVAVFYLWVRFIVFPSGESFHPPYPTESLIQNVLLMVKVFAIYFGWMITGVDVHVTKLSLDFYNIILPVGGLVLFLIVVGFWLFKAFVKNEYKKLYAFSLLWFVVTMLPMMNIIPLQNIYASRYLYLPAIGFYIVMVTLFYSAVHRKTRFAVIGLFVLFLSVGTVTRIFALQNEITLRQEFLKHYPNDPLSYRVLSGAYTRYGFEEKALNAIQEGLKQFPKEMSLQIDLARMNRDRGNYQAAIDGLKEILEDDPQHYFALSETCINHALLNQRVEATACFERALSFYPDNKVFEQNFRILKDN